MKLRSITFRCTAAQFNRLQQAMQEEYSETRTSILSAALEEFLDYAERGEMQRLNLFDLVQHLDGLGDGIRFSDQA